MTIAQKRQNARDEFQSWLQAAFTSAGIESAQVSYSRQHGVLVRGVDYEYAVRISGPLEGGSFGYSVARYHHKSLPSDFPPVGHLHTLSPREMAINLALDIQRMRLTKALPQKL